MESISESWGQGGQRFSSHFGGRTGLFMDRGGSLREAVQYLLVIFFEVSEIYRAGEENRTNVWMLPIVHSEGPKILSHQTPFMRKHCIGKNFAIALFLSRIDIVYHIYITFKKSIGDPFEPRQICN